MKGGASGRWRGLLLIAALVAWLPGVAAQTLPATTEGDLLLPPAMRPGAPPSRPAEVPPRRPRGAATRASAEAPPPRLAARPAKAEHPVDVGVVMRGGSATPRIVSPLGSTQAVRESGNAFGAGMRIGF